jgi:glyceraldehyde-3-phosphate dehydrogenase (NADP+)
MSDAKVAQRIANLFPTPGEIPEPHRLSATEEQEGYLVGGEIRPWDGPRESVFSPVCTVGPGGAAPVRLGSYPLLTGVEAQSALEAAQVAWDCGRGAWPTMELADRIRYMEEFVFRMVERRSRVVQLLMWEIGKTFPDAQREFDRTVDYIRETIGALKDLDRSGSRFEIREKVIAQIRHAPLGVVLCLGPYNYPLNETFTTLIPALLMGNVVIFKPPRFGVLLHAPLLEAFRDCFPPGVVNTVYGEGPVVVGPLMESGGIDVLAFIGSSRVANILERQHPRPNRLKCVLGLEAKNAGIILADADLDIAVRECVTGTLSFNGQRCTALKILHVHQDIVDPFLSRYVAAMEALRFGLPWEDGVSLTPMPDPGRMPWLTGLLDDALAHGAEVLNEAGGTVHETYLHPAVLYPTTPEMKMWSVEQFGPLVPIAPFDDLEPVIRSIEESDFGQQVSLFGRDPDRMARLIDRMVNQVCRVNLNSQCQRGPDVYPFTGRKDSAEGTLSVSDALRVFAIRTLVAARDLPENRDLINEIVRERKSKFLSTDFLF